MDASKTSRRQRAQELEALRARVAQLEQIEAKHLQAEEALCKWSHVFEHAGWGIVISSADGKTIETMNPAFARMHGYTVEELTGRPIAEVFAPESRAALPMHLQLAHEQGRNDFEANHLRKDGSAFPTVVHLTLVKDEDGCVCGRALHVEDITERKREEAMLRVQRRLVILLGLTSNLSEGLGYLVEATCQIEGIDCASVFLVDKQTGAFNLVSNRGLSPEFVKRSFHFNANTSLAQQAMAGWSIFWSAEDAVPEEQQALRQHAGLRALAMIPVLHGGKVVAMLNPGSRTCDSIESARHTLGAIAAQIGEFVGRTKTEEALNDSLLALQNLYDTAGDFLFILDKNGNILRVNRTARKRLGYLLERELIGSPILRVYPPDRQQEAQGIIADMMVEQTFACHVPLMTKDGNLIPVEMRLVEGRWDNRDVFFGLCRDITERRQAENALYASEEKYRTLFETLSQGIVYQDADGQIISANPAAASILGMTIQQMQGRTSVDPRWKAMREDGSNFPGEMHPAMVALRTGTEVRNVVMGVFSPHDGEWRWIKVDAIPQFRRKEDKPFQVYSAFDDITERKRAEKALRQSEEMLKKSQEIAHLGSWELDLIDNRLTWSDEVYRIFGLKPQEFSATYEAFLDTVHPDDRTAVNDAYADSLREGRDSYELEHRIVKGPLGEIRYLHEKCEHLRDKSGKVVRSVGMVHDITERKQAEDALRRQNDYLNALQKTTLDLISWIDLSNMLEKIVKRAGLLMGTSSGFLALVDEQTNDLKTQVGLGALAEFLQCTTKQGKGLAGIVWQTAKPLVVEDYGAWTNQVDECGLGAIRSIIAVPLVSGSQVLGVLGLAHDAHSNRVFGQEAVDFLSQFARLAAIAIENARLVEALRASNAELQSRSEELKAFGHTVAHDLKNPLSNIIGFAYLMEDTDNPLTEEEMLKMIQTVKQLGLKMDSIIEEIMLLAGLRKESVKMEPLDMGTIITEILWRLTPLIDEFQAEIISPPGWPTVVGHAPWVEEIWINYITNAIKYGGRPPHVELGTTQEDSTVHFWVRDNGPGLTPEEQTRLFKPFERLDQIHVSGHGLGLSIVQWIVERMGGQVGVESTGVAGEGSTFSFTLPAG